MHGQCQHAFLLGVTLVEFWYIPACTELYRSLIGPLCGSLSVYFTGYLLPYSVSLSPQYMSHKHTNYEPSKYTWPHYYYDISTAYLLAHLV